MNLLVTGAAGFIGSHFVRHVRQQHPNWSITVLDALTYAGNESTMADFREAITFVKGEIQDAALVAQVMKDRGITHAVNFAAETHNDRSILGAAEFIDSNVRGVYSLLEASRACGLAKIVQVSTDEVYGSIASGEFTERSPIEPNTPYSASKAGGEMMCRAHFQSFGTPVCITRGGNTYGPFQYPEKLISFFCTRIIDGRKVPLYGQGSQIREWIHAQDHAAGVLRVLTDGIPGEAYNVGDHHEKTNLETTNFLISELGGNSDLIKFIEDPRKGAHDARYSMNCSKLAALGWSPTVDFEIGLRDTARWYAKNESWWRPIVAREAYQAYIRRFYGPGLGEDL